MWAAKSFSPSTVNWAVPAQATLLMEPRCKPQQAATPLSRKVILTVAWAGVMPAHALITRRILGRYDFKLIFAFSLPPPFSGGKAAKMEDSFFGELRKNLPVYLTRRDIGKYFGNVISPRYLANLDSLGNGPQKKRMRGKVVYKRDDFIVWLESRIVASTKRIAQ
jgi:hypothetical protein